uniref:Uncharacterized protein n=1 Tax=Anopheles minimus TaxID=112268 RepID=A0A182WPG5_9DIPT
MEQHRQVFLPLPCLGLIHSECRLVQYQVVLLLLLFRSKSVSRKPGAATPTAAQQVSVGAAATTVLSVFHPDRESHHVIIPKTYIQN